ncbi:phosphatidate cytidylyltransferase, partial [Thermus scotoductus]|uniref:phosphatidate cytidylyltransferase n=1 Tax=Thermus scotoductus TaxID=37636 RepID=UPI001004810E
LSLPSHLAHLVDSILPRSCPFKDSGHFLPGHSRLLDTIDRLLFTFPLTYSLLVLFT